MSTAIRKHTPWVVVLASLALMVLVVDLAFGYAHLIKAVAKIPDNVQVNGNNVGANSNDSGLGRFIDTANGLLDPAALAMAAIAPLACLVGAGALMFGSRRGLVIIGAALGTLVFVVSIKGIVA
jgi:hypothetical protein